MAGNRVEELEAKVRELEATVNGLTDELVETKERLRLIEDHIGTDELDGIIEGRASRAQARETVSQQRRGATKQPGTQEAVDEAVKETVEEEAAADGGKDDEAEADDESSEQSDDIIVA